MKTQLEWAIEFASARHMGQVRKGTTLPYIVHPIEVMHLHYRMGADENLLIAGVLHDTLEDTDTTEEEILSRFGEDVANLVAGHSEDKSKTWQERKTAAIEHLATADRRFKMLVLADKLSNMRAIAADYRAVGDKLWERFNAPPEKQAWYYSKIDDALSDLQNDPHCADAYWEYNARFKDVFVKFYRSKHTIYQVCLDGTGYYYDKYEDGWKIFVGNLPERARLLDRVTAELLEEEWAAGQSDFLDSMD